MYFTKFCQWLSNKAGRPSTFLAAVVLILLWGLSGPHFHYNDTWQLIVNTSTTIITFMMVFLIQNTQNRDNDILHVKLDELIRATKSAENSVMDLEALGSSEVHALRKDYEALGGDCPPVCPGGPVQKSDTDRGFEDFQR